MEMSYDLVFRKADYGLDSVNENTEISLDSFLGKKWAMSVGTRFEELAYNLFDAAQEDVLFFAGMEDLEALLIKKLIAR